MPHTDPTLLLLHLRLSVLSNGEQISGKFWDSSGISEAGQNDLRMVFANTSIATAATHSSELAQAHHDQATRASGVHHLFRLPTHLEVKLHRQLLDQCAEENSIDLQSWSWMDALHPPACQPESGALNLGTIDLTNEKEILRLAAYYRASMEAEQECIPYFKIA